MHLYVVCLTALVCFIGFEKRGRVVAFRFPTRSCSNSYRRQGGDPSYFALQDFRRPKPKKNKGGGSSKTKKGPRSGGPGGSGPKGRGGPDGEEREGHNKRKRREPPPFGEAVTVVNQPPPKTIAKTVTKNTNILGQNVVTCRDFSVNSAKTADFIGSYPSVEQMPIFSIPELAFLGRSNVGKSSLFNCLIGTKVAVSSKTPGRTQSLNTFTCKDKDGDIAVMVDLPGYGYAKLSKEKQEEISKFIESYLIERKSLRLVVLLVDCRRDVQSYEKGVLDFLRNEGLQYIVVATKIDKLGKNEARAAMNKYRRELDLEEDQMIGFSSLTAEGRRDLWWKIRAGLTGTVSEAFADEEEEEEEEEGGAEEEAAAVEDDDDEVGWG